jgi:hypothetical protein
MRRFESSRPSQAFRSLRGNFRGVGEGARQHGPTNTNRSKVPKTNLFGELRRSTLICCRRTRISASSRARERNKPMSANPKRMKTSTIGHEHYPIRAARQSYRVSDKDRQCKTVAVIGNGIIGHGVAQVFGMAGIGVVMIGAATGRIRELEGRNKALENAIGELEMRPMSPTLSSPR